MVWCHLSTHRSNEWRHVLCGLLVDLLRLRLRLQVVPAVQALGETGERVGEKKSEIARRRGVKGDPKGREQIEVETTGFLLWAGL
jgi:hypothetical protein